MAPRNFRRLVAAPTDLLQRVYNQQVVLEHIFTRGITAYGTVRVTNRSFDKRVLVQYTNDRCTMVPEAISRRGSIALRL